MMNHNSQNTTEWDTVSPGNGRGQQRLRVLWVGGEASVRDQLVEYLGQVDGCEVDTAASSQEALARFERTQDGYEVVVIDDLLASEPGQEPEPQGVKFMVEVKARYPDLEFVLLTDQGEQAGLEALRTGAHRYLTKPVNLEELELVLQITAEYSRLKFAVQQKTATVFESGLLLAKVAGQSGPSEWAAAQLLVLHEITKKMQSALGQPDLLDLISQLAAKLLDGDAAGILLLDDKKQYLTFKGAYGLSQRIVGDTCDVVGESIAGRVIESGEPIIANDIGNDPRFYNPAADREGLLAIISTPLQVRDEIIGTLDVHSRRKRRAFDEEDLRFLSLMTTQAAVAIQNAELAARKADKLRRLERLAQVGGEIMGNLGEMSLDQRLNLIAKYAVEILEAETCGIFLVKHPEFLSLEASYGHWEEGFEKGKELAIRSGPQTGLTGHIAYEGKLFNAFGDSLTGHPAVRGEAAHTASGHCYSLLAIPLKKKSEHKEDVVGLLRMDNKKDANGQTGPTVGFTREDEWILRLFADAAIVAIEGVELVAQLSGQKDRLAQLVELADRHKQLLATLYEASNVIVSSQDPEQAQQIIVERARMAVNATRVILILIDETVQIRKIITAGGEVPVEVTDVIRPEGLSMRVMRTGHLVVIEDANIQHSRVNPSKIWRNMVAGLCLPVSLEEKQIGVMWVHYDRPHHFVGSEIEALQLYVNQSAIVYDSARRIKELEYMRQAAEALAGVAEPLEVLKQIVESASEVLQADSVSTSSYDIIRGKFTLDSSVAAGIPAGVWSQFCQHGSWQSQTDGQVMEQGWIGVEDVGNGQQYPFLEGWYQQFLEQAGIQSFQGIALTVEEETLGVLYVNYRLPRSFSEEERKTARTFANHAALVLKKAKLLEQVSKARNTAKVVAEVTTLENIEDTLELIAEGTQDALNCDVVTLYGYDQHKDRLNYPPAMAGVWYPEQASRRSEFAPNYIIFEVLKRGRLYIVEDVATHPFFKDRQFVQDEQISSCVAIPLQVGPQKVGVMFVNYRSSHRFTWDELTNIQLFADQAGVAIRNVQLYERVQKRAAALQAIYEAGQAVTASLDLDQILSSIVEQAWQLISIYGDKKVRFSHLALVEGNLLRFVAAYPPERLSGLKENIGDIDLASSRPIGVTGQAVQSGQSQLIDDVTRHPDYLEGDPESLSELAVPIKVGEGVIGAINVEHSDSNAFDEDDQHALEALAAQAAIAIQNAQLYEQAERRVSVLNMLYEAGRAVTSSLKLDNLLDLLAEQAWHLTIYQGKKISFASIRLVEVMKLELVAAYPPEELLDTSAIWGEEIDLRAEADTPLGIVGRAVKTGEPQLVGDVTGDSDYLETHPQTRSELAVPIKISDDIIGAINVEHPEYNAFGQEDQYALESLAAQAAVAIQNARLFRGAQRHVRLLDAAARVSRGATGILDEDQLLDQAVQLIVNSFDFFYHAAVFLLDDNREYAILRAAFSEGGQRMLERGHKLKVGQEGIVGFVTQYGEPRLTPDVKEDPHHLVNPDLPETRAEVAFPLIARDQVIGALDVQSNEGVNLKGEDVATLQTMADQLANAIHNARLFEAEQRRVEHLATVHRVSVTANSTMKMDKILHQTVAEMVWAFLGIDQGDMVLFNLQDNHGRIVAGYPHPEEVNTSIPLAETSIEWILTHKQPLVIENVFRDTRLDSTHWMMKRGGVRSMLSTPLLVSDEVMGTINLYAFHAQRQFTAGEVEFAQTMANQVVTVIKNLQAREEVSAIQTVNSAFMLLSRWAHKVRQKSFALRKDLDSLKKDLPMGLFDDTLERMSESIQALSLPARELVDGVEESPEQVVDLGQLLSDVATRLCRNRKVSIELVLNLAGAQDYSIKGNRLFLEIAVEMLLENAVESIEQKKEPGMLEMQCCLLDDIVSTQIRDTGCGIPAEIGPDLFHGRVASKKGFGYGSFTAASILRANKGDIRVVETNDEGTLIEFHLPAYQIVEGTE